MHTFKSSLAHVESHIGISNPSLQGSESEIVHLGEMSNLFCLTLEGSHILLMK